MKQNSIQSPFHYNFRFINNLLDCLFLEDIFSNCFSMIIFIIIFFPHLIKWFWYQMISFLQKRMMLIFSDIIQIFRGRNSEYQLTCHSHYLSTTVRLVNVSDIQWFQNFFFRNCWYIEFETLSTPKCQNEIYHSEQIRMKVSNT